MVCKSRIAFCNSFKKKTKRPETTARVRVFFPQGIAGLFTGLNQPVVELQLYLVAVYNHHIVLRDVAGEYTHCTHVTR
ncbi:Hypothetical protein UVM_LOCUS343 [uncultured virus]|nr:Hypothetical protein UVM_LOCUS343 [uncultured virus]